MSKTRERLYLDAACGQAHLESAVRSASNRSRNPGSTDTFIPDTLPIFGGYHDGNIRNHRDNWANSQVFSQTACNEGRTPLVVMIPESYEELPDAQRARIIPICIAAFDQYGQRIAQEWFFDGVAPVREQLVKLAKNLLGDAWCVSELAEAAVHRLWSRHGAEVGRFPARRVLKKALCVAEEWKAGDWRKRRYPKLYLDLDALDQKVRDQMLADPNEYTELFEQQITLDSIEDRLQREGRHDIRRICQLIRRGHCWQEVSEQLGVSNAEAAKRRFYRWKRKAACA